MIFDKISNLKYYNSTFKIIAEYLENCDVQSLELGKYEIAHGIIMNVQSYTTKTASDKVCEVHEEKVDIQYIYEGAEKMLFGDAVMPEAKIPYNPDKDVAHHEALHTVETIVRAGHFCAYLTGEYHKPGLCVIEPNPVKKILIKIDKALLA